MNLNWKRIALVIGFIAGVMLFGYLLYYIFFKPTLPNQLAPNVNAPGQPVNGALPTVGGNANIPLAGNNTGALPGNETQGDTPTPLPATQPSAEVSPVASGGVTTVSTLTNTSAYQPTLAADGQHALYYDPATGKFYQVSPSGKATPFSDQVFFDIQNVSWAPDRSKAVIEYPDGANIIYNFYTKKQVTLPNHWKEFSFSPTNQQLVFKSMGLTPENRWLAIVNADGSQAQKIENLGDSDATVHPSWSPNGQIIAMYTEDKEFDQQNLYFLGKNDENFKLMTINGRDFRGVWSTRGDKLLYSVYASDNDYKPTLWVADAQGDNIGQGKHSLKIDTWADHCTFADNDTVYCAVPQSLPRGSGIFANDLDDSPSDIYKIDLKNGFRSKIATPERDFNIQNVFVSDDQDVLYFTSKTDGRLYSIRLK